VQEIFTERWLQADTLEGFRKRLISHQNFAIGAIGAMNFAASQLDN
jgi:hypothetical protein